MVHVGLFSAVANLEGQYQIQYGKLIPFSEQQIVDCDKVDGGCNGGLMSSAYEYIEQQGGLESTADYAYKAKDGRCKFNKKKVAVKVSSYIEKKDINDDEIKTLLVQNGPLSIAINADLFQDYESGILVADEDHCDPAGLNHGVAIVGYGSENGQDYYIIKNSWGANWGEKGYIRVATNGTCGLNQDVLTATIA